MLRILLIIAVVASTFSCSKVNEPPEDSINGSWQLYKLRDKNLKEKEYADSGIYYLINNDEMIKVNQSDSIRYKIYYNKETKTLSVFGQMEETYFTHINKSGELTMTSKSGLEFIYRLIQ